MGMITRVRARLQSISTTHKLDAKPQDDRNTKTMCVLSALLLVPCFARLPSTFLFTSVTIAYCVVVLPFLLSGLSRRRIVILFWNYLSVARAFSVELHVEVVRQPISAALWRIVQSAWCRDAPPMWMQSTINAVKSGVFNSEVKKAYAWLEVFLLAKHRLEMGFLRMGNISNLFSQILFFAMCDRLFCLDQTLTCLYSLMFYNVITYCIAYAYNVVTKTDWSPYVHISETTNVQHLAVTTTKMVLELTKAVTFFITAVFMLLVFGIEQGLEHYHPTWAYICVTVYYYVVTEKTFSVNFYIVLEKMKLEYLDGLEKLWAPVILKGTICLLSAVVCLPLFYFGFFRFSLISFYVNVFLAYKDCVSLSWTPLKQECASLAKYRYATREELRDVNDVCAVCLQPMRFARFTPCHHMFHGDCLRLCMKASTVCPMCKQEL